ncbi:ATP-grasp domain-containing protein [Flavobacterium kingsejongi]|uniref:Prokaryotic glutathione synthetase ATP-binding domain-containing protein n=1 Tax=Flavobacterium kingsejongi TaxID=1678728 RepID=A0A2S1LMD3_9FLAO|nr:hypothetical protein [Flavobacterium kingsejongi]AWG24848.1 hypothetical protein FK004_06190 [Flavobacterium kingsejongi]
MTIAYITYNDKGAYSSTTVEEEDNRLLNFLIKKGLTIEKVIWNDPAADWKKYDLALLKSPWDYFDYIHDFYQWLEMLESNNIRLLNPSAVLKWNADKHYLQDIQSAGLPITESHFIPKGTAVLLHYYFKLFNANAFIIKPCISGGSKNTYKVTPKNATELNSKIKTLLTLEDFIIQPFLPEIEKEGEWSFVFFNGKFSHALIKKAKQNDFRVQPAFGGTIHPQTPSSKLLKDTQRYIDQFAPNCLYARVDGVLVDNTFILMELELIEPFLFLNTHPENYEHYYQALAELIQ